MVEDVIDITSELRSSARRVLMMERNEASMSPLVRCPTRARADHDTAR
jgi:hypothetical protein